MLKRFLNALLLLVIMAEAEAQKESKERKPKRTARQLYMKYYKLLLAFPLFLLFFSLVYIASFYAKTGCLC